MNFERDPRKNQDVRNLGRVSFRSYVIVRTLRPHTESGRV